MTSIPTLTRGFSGGGVRKKSRSPRRNVGSLEKELEKISSGSNHGKMLSIPSMMRSISGSSVPTLIRNVSGHRSKSPVRRSNSWDSTSSKRKAKKTQGFDETVSRCLTECIAQSPVLSQPKEPYVTYFAADQIVRGGRFQSGEYFEFIKVKSLPVQTNSLLDDDDSDDSDSSDDCFAQKQYIIKQLSQKNARVKLIMQQATVRLVLEAKFLARLNHPNLVQLRGMSQGEEAPLLNGGVTTFFTVLEACTETLDERLERWKRETTGAVDQFDLNSPEAQLKMKYAVDLAKALSYLHERNIVVLNLRPENIGFLEDDTIQIRDLTCCREAVSSENAPKLGLNEELKLGLNAADKNDTLGFTCDLESSGDAESHMTAAMSNFLVLEATVEGQPRPRFVAPEAIVDKKYTEAADTYSWAHILFYMLSLSKPYASYKLGTLLTKVCMEGSRPNLSVYGFPDGLEHLLKLSWSKHHFKRPPMKALLQAIPLLLKISAQGGTTPQA